jgi:hypothetical protein
VPLKRIALSFGDLTVSGEAVISGFGLEGGAVYPLSAPLRDEIDHGGLARFHVDLRPDLSLADLAAALSRPRGKQSTSTFLRKATGLPPVSVALLREAAGPSLPGGGPELARLIKNLPMQAVRVASLDRAISTAGGVDLHEVDGSFMLKRVPGVFVAGEMLDWEAPTGGYLLQACFSTGVAAARGALTWLRGAVDGGPSP